MRDRSEWGRVFKILSGVRIAMVFGFLIAWCNEGSVGIWRKDGKVKWRRRTKTSKFGLERLLGS